MRTLSGTPAFGKRSCSCGVNTHPSWAFNSRTLALTPPPAILDLAENADPEDAGQPPVPPLSLSRIRCWSHRMAFAVSRLVYPLESVAVMGIPGIPDIPSILLIEKIEGMYREIVRMYKYLLLFTGSFLLLCSFFYLKEAVSKYREGFEEEQTWEEKANILYKLMADELCPPLLNVISELSKDDDNKPFDEYVNDKADGSVMFCPPVEDITALPPDIGNQISRTARFLAGELGTVMSKLRKGLEKSCKEQKKRAEGFDNFSQSVPDLSAIAVANAKSEAAFAEQKTVPYTPVSESDPASETASASESASKASKATKAPKPPKPRPDPMREYICAQRYASIYSVLSSGGIYGNLIQVRNQYAQLKNIQQNPRTVKSLC